MSVDAAPGLQDWPGWLKDDLAAGGRRGWVGQQLVSESERVRVWSLRLAPGARIGFHRHVLDYFWTALSDGRARSHYGDGRTQETTYRAGDTKHMRFARGEAMVHDLENIGDTELAFTTVEFLDSANAPLDVPARLRRSA